MASVDTPPPPVNAGDPTPPSTSIHPADWVRENLFNTWYNAVITVVLGAGLAYGIVRIVRFVFVTARWEAIRLNLTLLMVGLFPRGEVWRTWAALYISAFAISLVIGAYGKVLRAASEETIEAGGWQNAVKRLWPVAIFIVALLLLSGQPSTMILSLLTFAVGAGGFFAGKYVPLSWAQRAWMIGLGAIVFVFVLLIGFGGAGLQEWGGLLLTLFLATSSIILSFPFGVLAALGRRSSFPIVRVVSVGYIEFIRGVPLITLLLMGSLGLKFFLPEQYVPGIVIRAIIMMTLFTGAYVAEIVRGGLQSVPRGQLEAGQALGLPPVKILRLIILPQALRNVIPALVGQFISLFKDTSLVTIIALTDLLRVARNIIPGQPQFVGQGLIAETLAFAAFVYWVFAYTMSRESQLLEQRLGVGER